MKEKEKLTRVQELGFKDYDDYLNSAHWHNKREEFGDKTPNRCFVCQGDENLCYLHHLTYDRIGKENLTDLIWLCYKHHHQIHKIIDGVAKIPLPKKNAHIKMREQYVQNKIDIPEDNGYKLTYQEYIKKENAKPSTSIAKKPPKGLTYEQKDHLRKLGVLEYQIQSLRRRDFRDFLAKILLEKEKIVELEANKPKKVLVSPHSLLKRK